MKRSSILRPAPFLWAGGLFLALAAQAFGAEELTGKVFEVRGRKVTITRWENIPLQEGPYAQRFHFDSASNSKLKELREQYRLEEVAGAGSEFDRQVRLMDWVHRRFRKFGHPSIETKGALDILEGIEQGHSFFCTQYAQLMVSAAASLGWVDRTLALRRHQGVNARGGSTEHSTTEIWSNEFAKWVMLDPTSNLYLEKEGVPLNAWEIRQEWFYHAGRDLVFVIGKERQRYRKKDLPIFLERFADFGDLTIELDELDKYGFIGYIPNTDLMDAGFDYGQMFIVKDQLCAGTEWHVRDLPENPAVDPYFPIDQAALAVAVEGGELVVTLKTLTPNFARFEVKRDDGTWRPSDARFAWPVHSGANRLEARSVNAFGVVGPVSRMEARGEF